MVDEPGGGRTFIHVGTPKSGTSFIQASLVANRERLRAQGILYPTDNQKLMFRAASEMRERYHRTIRPPNELAGSWTELCARARAFPGTTVFSSELLGGAEQRQIERMLAELRGMEVHVVLTARSLARQLPAAWQESIKHGGRQRYADYLAEVTSADRGTEPVTGQTFWQGHDIVAVLRRWGAALPPEHVHLVTVPAIGSDPLVLWRRFCSVIGADAEQCPPSLDQANTSLGVVEIEVLRQVNRIAHQIARPGEDRKRMAKLVNRYLVRQVLRRYSSPRPETPQQLIPTLETFWAETCEAVVAAGYDVVGDLDELRPGSAVEEPVDPDSVPMRQVVRRASAAILDLLVEVDALRRELKAAQRSGPRTAREEPRPGAGIPVHRRLTARVRGHSR